ncbi:MAG: DUF1573 domain-containing protein [Saprospiraceae bacterium]|nr:DUF1573 domain-containing protein [Saprospiraceae bacterium]
MHTRRLQQSRKKKLTKSSGLQSFIARDSFPVISFDIDYYELDSIVHGRKMVLEYHFTNTGNKELDIELVTACKCTQLDWPRKPVSPGSRGVITVEYDTSTEPLGFREKTIDIIANTNPIVVEAKFSITIVKSDE